MLRFVTVLLFVVGTSGAMYFATEKRLQLLVPDHVRAVQGLAGLTGIAYWPEHATLIGVTGSGEVAEITLDGKLLRRNSAQRHALGDIVLGDEPGYALVTDAQDSRLLRLNLAELRFDADSPIQTKLRAAEVTPQRFEGITLQPGTRRLILANAAQPAALLIAAADEPTAREVVLVNAPSVSAVISDQHENLLLLSAENGLLLTTADGIPAGRWYPVKGRHVTAVTLVPGHGLVLATDQDPAQLLFLSTLPDWEAVRHALGS